MHECSLMKDFFRRIETVARQNGAQTVLAVRVRLGALSQISADHFREHFVDAKGGTIAENARLDIEVSTDINDPHACEVLLETVEVAE